MHDESKTAGEMAGLLADNGRPVPLIGVVIEGTLRGGRASMTLRQRYRNDEQSPIEAVYVFPLPAEAVVTGVTLRIGDRVLRGVIREREQAFREYDDAISTGHGAALLDRERHDVLTVQAGNLLPGEETAVEIAWTQAVDAADGDLIWSIPTVVAPRYIPGAVSGDRTAHGTAEPTDRVPDADRITPPVGWAPTGLTLDLVVDLGVEVEVESPSHPLAFRRDDHRVHVSLAAPHVALNRDLVLHVRGPAARLPLTAVATHKAPGQDGAVAITVVPDLGELAGSSAPLKVVFLVDTSGSMGGLSIIEAKSALSLCLRHLRAGDRFDLVAFDSTFRRFDPGLPTFDQGTLERADRWITALRADGGTELLGPLLAAVESLGGDGVVVLLTDGQVGNEDEILRRVLEVRGRTRVYSFGIGTAVSEGLLTELGRATGGAVERIYPGQSIETRVTAQFARAMAQRVEALSLRFEGVELHELAPSEPPALVDGEPWVLHARYARAGAGRLTLLGRIGAREVRVEVPLTLPEQADRPDVLTSWAAERFRELERARLTGRRAEANQRRMLDLALEHGLATRLTSFVVVEEREGARRSSAQPETRVVAVHAPEGWDMLHGATRAGGVGPGVMPFLASAPAAAPGWLSDAAPRSKVFASPTGGVLGPPIPGPAMASAPPSPAPSRPPRGGVLGAMARLFSPGGPPTDEAGPAGSPPEDSVPQLMARVVPEWDALEEPDLDALSGACSEDRWDADDLATAEGVREAAWTPQALLRRQLASGLWDDPSLPWDGDSRRLRATAAALAELLHHGVTSANAVHGALIVKAVDAALAAVAAAKGATATDAAHTEAVLAAAWLVSTGRRRRAVEQAVTARTDLGALQAALGDRDAVSALLARRLASTPGS